MPKFPEELVSIVFTPCGLVLLNQEAETPDTNFNSVFVTDVVLSLSYSPKNNIILVLRMGPRKNTRTETYSRS
jgi:hypothetical protein